MPLTKVLRNELKVEDALLYLDQVKMAFGDKPEIYNEFLDIMKNFKAQEIDTPGVIQQVSHLFQGHNKLILGFNTFLPDGYKICLPGNDSRDSPMSIPVPSSGATSSTSSSTCVDQQVAACSIPARQRRPLDPEQLSALSHPRLGPRRHAEPLGSDADGGTGGGGTSSVHAFGAPKEFDHAITYVTTIKKRFAHAPETYKAFLEILHTYQKEQRSIKDVLEQVSQLFADHADLLQEFTYFLPDAVQEQAKERLTRAARESELRRERNTNSTTRSAARDMHAMSGERLSSLHGKQVADERMRRSNGVTRDAGSCSGMQSAPQRVTAPIPGRASATCELISTSDSNAHFQTRSPTAQSEVSQGGVLRSCQHRASERYMLERVKEHLSSNTTRYPWSEFLKCLDLYSQGLLRRYELLHLLSDLLGKRSELLEELKRTLTTRASVEFDESLAQTSLSSWTAMLGMEFDFVSSKQKCGPSYCALRSSLPPGMSSFDEQVFLNNRWVLQAADSEESHSLQSFRKTQYERATTKCERLHFEIDMIINSGKSAIRTLEPLEAELDLKGTWQQDMPSRLRWSLFSGTLSFTDLHILERLYGAYSAELLTWLVSYPEAAVPVILQRLRQKFADWRFSRQEVRRNGRVSLRRNLCRALDHRSHSFRQRERRSFFAGRCFSEASSRSEEQLCPTNLRLVEEGKSMSQDIAKATRLLQEQTDAVMRSSEPFLHHILRGVLRYAVDLSNLSQYDKKLLSQVWDTLISPLLGLPQHSCIACHDRLQLASDAPVQTEELQDGDTARAANLGTYDPTSPTCPKDSVVQTALKSEFIGTQAASVVIRLYQMLFERVALAYNLCADVGSASTSEVCDMRLQFIGASKSNLFENALTGPCLPSTCLEFNAFTCCLCGVLDGSCDTSRFEDLCHVHLGKRSYPLFTIDRLIALLIKQLHVLALKSRFHEVVAVAHSRIDTKIPVAQEAMRKQSDP